MEAEISKSFVRQGLINFRLPKANSRRGTAGRMQANLRRSNAKGRISGEPMPPVDILQARVLLPRMN